MAVRKIAISLPEDVLRQVDRLAKRTHTTRSGCIARVMAEVSHATTQGEITARINELFGEKGTSIQDEQLDTSRLFLSAAEDSEW